MYTILSGITGAGEADIITFTSKAVEQVKSIKDGNSIPETFGLRVAVKGGGCSGLMYNLGFDESSKEGDTIADLDGVNVFIDAKSLFYLLGVQIDFTDGLNGRGFTFENPNAQRTCGCGSSFAA